MRVTHCAVLVLQGRVTHCAVVLQVLGEGDSLCCSCFTGVR